MLQSNQLCSRYSKKFIIRMAKWGWIVSVGEVLELQFSSCTFCHFAHSVAFINVHNLSSMLRK